MVKLMIVVVAILVATVCQCESRKGQHGGNGHIFGPFGRGHFGGRRSKYFIAECESNTIVTQPTETHQRAPRKELKCTDCINDVARICTFVPRTISSVTITPAGS